MVPGRSIRALVVATVLVFVSVVPLVSSGASPPSKVDATLAAELESGSSPTLRLIVAGYAGPTPDAVLPTRAAWDSFWAAGAAGFGDEVARLAAANHATVTHVFPSVPVAFVTAPRSSVASFAASREVRLLGIDSDTSIHLLDAASDGGPSIDLAQSVPMTQAPDLWSMGFRGEGVLIAGVDTGIDATHPMFRDAAGHSRVVRWMDELGQCAQPCDPHGHGTHTASTFAGTNEFGGLYNGMAPHATIMGVRILDAGGSGSWEGAQAGLQFAFDNGADLTSNSWGGSCDAGGSATRDLADSLSAAGMTSVFAAGNSGPGANTIGCPGDGDRVITVGAVDKSKVVASFSSRGTCSDGRICPDVAAVGVSVTAAWTGGGYATLSGTSMATPHVAGAVALLEQVARERRVGSLAEVGREAETILKATAQDLGAPGPDNDYGWGFIEVRDAANALASNTLLNATIALDHTEIRNTGAVNARMTVGNGGNLVDGTLTTRVYRREGADLGTLVAGPAYIRTPSGTTPLGPATVSGAGLLPEQYVIRETYDYRWNDSSGVTHTAPLQRWASFLVKGVRIAPSFSLPATAAKAKMERVSMNLKNVGNERGHNITATLAVPFDYAIQPVVPPIGSVLATPSKLWGLASPPPSSATVDATNKTLVLVWDGVVLDAGQAWTSTIQLVPLAPQTNTFVVGTTWLDTVNVGGAAGATASQTVS